MARLSAETALEPGWISDFHAEILGWYEDHGRRLPWRETRDPYRIMVSELMLQQTQADRVIPKYQAFLDAFPSVEALAGAELGDVLRLWSGLGYNRRAKYLWLAAREITTPASRDQADNDIVRHSEGVLVNTAYAFPLTASDLRPLPGIGPYTASAIAVFAYGHDEVLLETNTRRIYQLLFTGEDLGEGSLRDLAEQLLPRGRSADWHHALMDLGSEAARVKSARAAQGYLTSLFPMLRDLELPSFSTDRVTRPRQSPFEGSRRQIRGGILKALADGPVSQNKILKLFPDARTEAVLEELLREGFLQRMGATFSLR